MNINKKLLENWTNVNDDYVIAIGDSMMRELPLGQIVQTQDYQVIDGKKRLSAVYRLFNEDFYFDLDAMASDSDLNWCTTEKTGNVVSVEDILNAKFSALSKYAKKDETLDKLHAMISAFRAYRFQILVLSYKFNDKDFKMIRERLNR